jgi:SPP1 family predicted phage head-tail adaptor
MRAGATNRRIVVEENTGATFNDFGERIENWTFFRLLWAEVQEKGGREFFEASQDYALRKIVFRVRPHYANITVAMRIRYDSMIFHITALQEIGRREGLLMMAEEIK